ncbi:hypothetical protein MOQ72_42940 [Saccharopolyspora sp. K220]|uniref:hypothetical protein n=1 Tax=Saccharopolyspora soli TaxID=2926618 RepID=UPI001F590DCE|nr:hypothetical protein [Saccharopolyspora soli]MCI2424172.1 hypothetical protein [Saccharopolyspora soli]
MNDDDPDAGLVVEIWRLFKLAGVRDDIAIARFHQLIDRHGYGEMRKVLVAVAPEEVANVPLRWAGSEHVSDGPTEIPLAEPS